jgi:AraC-like DNA-binding protein
MKDTIQHIDFDNKSNPKSYLEVIRIEELLTRKVSDHDPHKNHIVKFYIIFFITSGEGNHTIDFIDYRYQQGTVLLIRQDQVHKFFRSSNVKGYLLIFTEEFILSHLNKLEVLKSFQLFNELLSFPKIELNPREEEFSSFDSLVKQIEREYKFKDEYSLGITRSALHIVITKLFRIKSQNAQVFGKKKYLAEFLSFQKMVENNCFNNKKVDNYAKELGFSTKTLNNIVQSIANKSAKVLIDEIAIMQIKRLLISTNESIKEIAYTAGFDDPSNFFKYFKKYVGSSPEVFRQSQK